MPIEYAEHYNTIGEMESSILGQAKNFTLATIADIGTSLWNSIPFTPEAQTEDILDAIDSDAAKFYTENPDAVNITSLIGGSLIPGGVVLKLLNRARSGKGVLGFSQAAEEGFIKGSFTGSRQKVLSSEIEKAFSLGGPGTKEYQALKRQYYASNAFQQVADNALIELAVVGALNAHPYMEDYFEDFGKNFTIGIAAGGVLGGLFSLPISSAGLRRIASPIETVIAADILESGYVPIDPGMTAASRVQVHSSNIRAMEELIAKQETDNLARQTATSIRRQEEDARAKLVKLAFPKYENSTDEVKAVITDILSNTKFEGVDRIKLVNLDRLEKITARGVSFSKDKIDEALLKEIIDEAPVGMFGKTIQQQTGMQNPNFLTPEGKAAVVFYRPSTGETFAAEGVRNAASASDIPKVFDRLRAAVKERQGRYATPINGFVEDNRLRTVSAAESDLEYLIELSAFNKLSKEAINNITVAPDHFPRMQALMAYASKLTPAERIATKVRITATQPSYSAQQKVLRTLINDEHVYPAGYSDTLYKLTTSDAHILAKKPLSRDAKALLGFWTDNKYGGKNAWEVFAPTVNKGSGSAGIAGTRRAFDSAFRNTAPLVGEEKWVDAAKELYEAGASFREALKEIADPEGYIILFRGIRAEKAVGHAAVESYSISRDVSQSFSGYGGSGTKLIARVHIDDIIGTTGGKYASSELEVMVGSRTQQLLSDIPKEGTTTQLTKHIDTLLDEANEVPGVRQISLEDIAEHYAARVGEASRAMTKDGVSIEEISARLNITRQAVMDTYAGLNVKPDSFRYTDPAKIADYLSEKNKLFALAGNPSKNYVASAVASLDRRQLAVAHKEIIDQITDGSKSEIAKSLKALYELEGAKLQLDRLVEQVSTIVNARVGNFRWQSADQLLRDLEIGPLISGLGKRFTDSADLTIKKVIAPVATAWKVFRDDPAGLVEFNKATSKLSGIAGWRDWVRLEETGAYTLVQRQGKNLVPVMEDGVPVVIKQQSVIDALEEARTASRALFDLHNTIRAIEGKKPLTDLGFYLPPVSLVNKNISYVIDKTGQKEVQLLVANNAEELKSLEKAWAKANAAERNRYDLVVEGADQKAYNNAKGYVDAQPYITLANVAYQHAGKAASAIIPSDFRFVESMLSSYENQLLQAMRKYNEHYLKDAMYWLDELSGFYQRETAVTARRGIFKESPRKDAALTIKNILLGRDQLEQSVGLKITNSFYDFAINKAVKTLDDHVTLGLKTKKSTIEYFNELTQKLEDAGVTSPWKTFDEYLATTEAASRNIAPQVQSAGNGMMAALNLRILELAQPLINIMSLPILTWSALMEKLPGTQLGNNSMMKFPLRVMYEGGRHMNSIHGKELEAFWDKHFPGIYKQATRQYTEITSELKSAYRGGRFSDKAIELANNIQENRIVKDFLAKPSDWAEEFTRRYALHTGYVAAKRAYPGIDDFGATIAAMNFADRSIGNYHAVQRPGVFQGTFGAAIGLYQTYMLTYLQSIYRGMENRNFKQIAALAMAQAGIFGVSSMPGFHLLSESIVGEFSDDHWDITTGTYRAFGNDAAEVILYGLPSSIGPALYTRGEVSPRIPSSATEIAMYNGIKQGWEAAVNIVQKSAEGMQDGNLGQSLMEALSLQSMNRPIARWAELVNGESVTRAGNTVSPSAEVWTPTGIFARLLGTRPIEEQTARNAVYLNKYYEALDADRRRTAVERLKRALRAGDLDDEILGETAAKYLRYGGTARGWNSAMNELFLKTEYGTRWDLLDKLEPNSPIRTMISDMY